MYIHDPKIFNKQDNIGNIEKIAFIPLTDIENEIALENEVIEPKKYKVFLLNDDFTTQEFVIDILRSVFHKDSTESINLMLKIHREGKGLCGIYPYDIAETKAQRVVREARAKGFPLRVIVERD